MNLIQNYLTREEERSRKTLRNVGLLGLVGLLSLGVGCALLKPIKTEARPEKQGYGIISYKNTSLIYSNGLYIEVLRW